MNINMDEERQWLSSPLVDPRTMVPVCVVNPTTHGSSSLQVFPASPASMENASGTGIKLSRRRKQSLISSDLEVDVSTKPCKKEKLYELDETDLKYSPEKKRRIIKAKSCWRFRSEQAAKMEMGREEVDSLRNRIVELEKTIEHYEKIISSLQVASSFPSLDTHEEYADIMKDAGNN